MNFLQEGITIRWVHAQFLDPYHPNFLNDCTLAPELTHGWPASDHKHKNLQVPNFCSNSGQFPSQGLIQFTSIYLRRYSKHTTAASGYEPQNQQLLKLCSSAGPQCSKTDKLLHCYCWLCVNNACLSQAEWELQAKLIREVLPLILKVQEGPPCFLSSFSESRLGVAGSNPRPRLSQQFTSKGYTGITEPLYNLVLQD